MRGLRKELIDGSAVYQKFIQKLQTMATVEAAVKSPRSPFFKGEVSFQDSNPSLEKTGKGDFGRLGKR